MKNFINHARIYIFRGLIAMIPILLCTFALRLLYVLIDRRVMTFISRFIEIRHIPGLGVLLLLICLYLIGLIVSNILGRQIFKFIEGISQRIPLIKTIYGVGKQFSHSLSVVDGKNQAFKKAVLVKINGMELMVPAFVMNSFINQVTNEEHYFVLVPASPTPTHGFLFVVKASQTIDPGWTVEECLKAVVSMGIVSPKEIKAFMK